MALNEVDPAANRYTMNGVTTVTAYTFEISSKNDLEALINTTTKTVDVDYSVDGIGNSGGGNVTWFTAPANGTTVTLLRKQPAVQASVYTANQGFPHAQVMADFDKLWMAVQQMREQLHRAMLLPKSSALVDQGMDVPTVGSFARGKVGGGIDWATVTSAGIITIPVPINEGGTGATTASGARTALDVPSNAEAILDTLINAKGDLIVGTGNDTPAILTVGANGQVPTADSAQSGGIAWAGPVMPNPIINGNMEIWQRGTAFNTLSATTRLADRWTWTHTGAGVVSVARSVTVPTVAEAGVLFNYSLAVTVNTADVALAASDVYGVTTTIEGYNWRHFAQRDFTISFWVRSSKTGIHSVGLHNSGGDRAITKEYTVNAADTWEYKTLTFAASPSAGTWDYTTGIGVMLWFGLASGTDRTTSTLNSWTSTNDIMSTNQVNVLDAINNVFRITGVKLELGSIATPIQFVPFEEELLRCMRYYQKSFLYATAPAQNVGAISNEHTFVAIQAGATTQKSPRVLLSARARTAPTITIFNPSAANAQVRNADVSQDLSASSIQWANETGFFVQATGSAGTAIAHTLSFHWTADAEL